MDPAIIAALAVIGVIVIGLLVWWFLTRDSRRLKKRFGPEYDRTVERRDSKQEAHEELEHRIERHRELELRGLDSGERERYVASWRELQRVFTKQPATGLLDADAVVTSLLSDVGYPTDGYEQQAADLSVRHADIIEDYRKAQAVVGDVRAGRAGTEDIRSALLRYRTVFEELVGTSVADDDSSDGSATVATASDDAPRLLADDDRTRLRGQWVHVEERFVDDPSGSVEAADGLVADVIERIRSSFDERRSAAGHAVTDEATTEQLREALHHYEVLFSQLADAPAPRAWHDRDSADHRRTGRAPDAVAERTDT